MAKRDILSEFQTYYTSLSPDAQEIVRRLVLTPPSKSQSPAPRAARSSSSKKKGLPSAPSIETSKEMERAAPAASGGD